MELFGAGTKKFAPGKDSGRDALFEGTAQAFPDKTKPWSGITVIQAKHTSDVTASCSDKAFARLMKNEVPKIQALRASKELDHYVCFTNRKAPSIGVRKLELELRKLTGVPHLMLVGLEYIEGTLTNHPRVIDAAGLRLMAPGLTIYPEDLEKLIQHFDANLSLFSDADAPAEPLFLKPGLPEKNALNQLSDDYFQSMIVEDSMAHFHTIEAFLMNPRNGEWKKRYANISKQFRNKYQAHRAEFPSFELIFNDIFDRLKLRDQVSGMDGLVYTFLHYMYCNCDLGRKTTAEIK